jgi:hypothetical protein
MSRSLVVSTDVFAAIWAQRRPGEDTEEAILRRVLGCEKTDPGGDVTTASSTDGGVNDTRNGVYFPENFEIVRSYKRKEYKARATRGSWRREDNGQIFPTLNQLNDSIAAGPENVWNGNWKYRDSDGTLRSINALRR